MQEILQQALGIVFYIGTATAVVVGLLALVAPGKAIALNASLGRGYRVPAVQQSANRTYRVERLFYRHHRIAGTLLILVSSFFFYSLWARFGLAASVRLFSDGLGSGILAEVLITSAIVLLALGNAVALVLGVVVLLRPSLLKRLESWTNRWISIEAAAEQLNRRRGTVDALFARWPRRVGVVLLLGGIYMAWAAWHFGF